MSAPYGITGTSRVDSRTRLGTHRFPASLGVDAARLALSREMIDAHDLGAVFCSTSVSSFEAPAMAYSVLHQLGGAGGPPEIPACDLRADGAGYLGALSAAYDHVHANADDIVLVLTVEALFVHAATATIVTGLGAMPRSWALLHRPILSWCTGDGRFPRVAASGRGPVCLAGRAASRMAAVLRRACYEADLDSCELEWVITHHENDRMTREIPGRSKLPRGLGLDQITRLGNTALSSIPLAVAEIAQRGALAGPIGLTAPGGGLTCGAAILYPGL
jgi:3-oxoacyl-[acyl-carrier-protein] synthase-3